MKYGWENSNDLLAPIITKNLPALFALAEMSFWGCRKECPRNRCKCFKSNLVCTDLCKSTSCKNNINDAENDIIYMDSDSHQ